MQRPPTIFGEDPRDLSHQILRSFVPHVSVYASEATEDLVMKKGFQYGLWELLRPFGETCQGKVTVQDSNGASRCFDDFSIRFTRLPQHMDDYSDTRSLSKLEMSLDESLNSNRQSAERASNVLAEVDSLVERHLALAEQSIHKTSSTAAGASIDKPEHETASSYYSLYLRRILSGTSAVPHETFAHPVACVIAISSQNESPIEELRKLYADSTEGDKRVPPWVDSDYLRYYVLVHDEDSDDITRSMGLFEQMKRHLGLHCHLLRLRCSKSAETDDDSMSLPDSTWISAAEELAKLSQSESEEDLQSSTHNIFETDAIAIRTFVRELVTQSIIPTMERHISVWNDQVASRRKGITGRFINLSRKWTGFGTAARASSGTSLGSGDNFETLGYYRAETAEAIMRKLADYAFMLRDWKLAYSTYDLLRSDFSESKAWKYHAAASEMAAISLLLVCRNLASKTRADTIKHMFDSAFYSYNNRCGASFGAARCLLIGMELLRASGGTGVDEAGRWALRLLEARILGRVGEALLKERLSFCYSSKLGVGSWGLGCRKRKAALWSILAAEAWCQQSKYLPARECLKETRKFKALQSNDGAGTIIPFQIAMEFVESLQLHVFQNMCPDYGSRQAFLREGQARSPQVENLGALTPGSRQEVFHSGTPILETAPPRDVRYAE
ncbi:hypothetical protein E4U22_001548 [Claviceps purpurea]|nr:hypothetical protein E4U12_000223 [Claviceps purpurea]KAG6150272.1 hypothetical protein E4U28_000052 [Claviceps purpurea]KAG6195869.1 hypothetical protein E4U50_008443 [Claviceps purpurea]KAG6281541.1 hypothetical protein E4U46_000289 [Claviceps purpurea]KAG6312789.1 hypothetical protein E4U22_001548 [Claviceps purpurea]